MSQASAIKFICGPGHYRKRKFLHRENDAVIILGFKRIFFNTLAAHFEGIPPIRLFDTLFSCQCPFKRHVAQRVLQLPQASPIILYVD
jgi:hypothetical protein